MKYSAIISYEGGSDFQNRSMENALRCLLIGWKEFYLSQHKKNKISISMTEPEKRRIQSESEKSWNETMQSIGH
jgi:hypothetical protein